MVVTEIKDGRGVKKHVYLDGEYSFTVDNDFLNMSGIYIGLELDDESVEKLKSDYSLYRAKQRALNLLSRRSHSARELKTKLMRNNDEKDAERAVQRMSELGYINDEAFAREYAREMWERRYFARLRIKRELLAKGVDFEIVSAVLDEFDSDEKERITELITMKYSAKLKDEKGTKSLFALLVRLGYSYSDIRKAINEFTETDFYEG